VDNWQTAMPLPKPYVRGLDHLVFAAFDCGRRLLADLRRRRVAGRLSSSMARDVSYWKMIIFPILLTIIGSAVGIAELHSACTAHKDDGLPLASLIRVRQVEARVGALPNGVWIFVRR